MKPDWKAIDEKMRQYASPKVSGEEKANIRSYVWCALLDEETENYVYKKFIYTDLAKDKNQKDTADGDEESNRKKREVFLYNINLRDRFAGMYLELIIETMEKYDSSITGSYSKYFINLAVRRGNNLFTRALVGEDMYKWIGDDYNDDENNDADIIVASEEADESYLLSDTAEWFLTFANMIMQAKLRDSDGKRSAEHLFYRSMFYSDTVSATVRIVPDLVRMMSKNNRLLFKAMDVLFLDYIFIKQCRRIRDLAECDTKRMCDMSEVNDPSEGCCKIPAPQKVFAGFMESIGKKTDVTTISKRQKSYLKEIEGLKELLGADVG